MTTMTLAVPSELKHKMETFPEMNWSEVARQAFMQRIKDLVIDSNVLFAALLKDSGTSNILFKHKLYAPEFIFEEFRKYKDYLKGKTKRTEEDFNELFGLFERNVILVPKEEIGPFM